MAYFNERLILTVVRWTARAIGTALLILMAAFAIGEGVPSHPPIAILMMLVGQIVAWKWEGIGGLLILGGFALFAIHPFRFNMIFGAWLATGLLYLVCWWRSGRSER